MPTPGTLIHPVVGNVLRYAAVDDPVDMARVALPWEHHYRQITPDPFFGFLGQLQTPRFQLSRVTFGRGLLLHGDTPPGAWVFAVFDDDVVHFRGRQLGRTGLACLRHGEDIDLYMQGTGRAWVLGLAEADAERWVHSITGRGPSKLRDIDRMVARDPVAARAVRDTWRSEFERWRSAPAGLLDPEAQHDAAQRLLRGMLEQVDLPQVHLNARDRYRILRRANRYLDRRLGEPVSIADLCRATGAAERTLHHVFHRQYGLPPMAYLKQLRLNRAREEMQSARSSDNVTQIALRCGFSHLGRFAADYRRLFGELPSQALRQVRPDGGGLRPG
ncbi:MAG: AraC family transcriptional regulator [Xanthomonadales bacterium]|nr:AraC family transcriptional regulator [Xanthomonadales bacterium]